MPDLSRDNLIALVDQYEREESNRVSTVPMATFIKEHTGLTYGEWNTLLAKNSVGRINKQRIDKSIVCHELILEQHRSGLSPQEFAEQKEMSMPALINALLWARRREHGMKMLNGKAASQYWLEKQ